MVLPIAIEKHVVVNGKWLEQLYQIWGLEKHYMGNEKEWKIFQYFNQKLNGGVLGGIFIYAAVPPSVTRWCVRSLCQKCYELLLGNVEKRHTGSDEKKS